MTDVDFVINLNSFNEGLSHLAHLDDQTYSGNGGQAAEMQADIISLPGYIQKSPGLANLTNGTQAGVVDQLIRHILDQPTDTDTTYAVGTSKLFKLSSTQVISGGSPSWPQTITGMTEGESVIRLKENLFVFYNKASGGDIAAMPLSSEVIDHDWGSSTDQALEKAPHPSAAKEDILLFGNGRYVGAYVQGSSLLNVRKLDFGEGSEVVDIVFHSNLWWIAVNYGQGRRGQVYLYDGSAMSNILSDEAGLGNQQIGFLYVHNGNVFVAYKDKTSDGYAIGFMSGRTIKPLRYFLGSLPDHRQKTLYKNTILFASGEDIYSCGAAVEQIPIQISRIADGGYATIGAVAAPFGTPIIASSSGSNHRIAKFSGYSTDSNWKSRLFDITEGISLGNITTVIIYTKPLHADAFATITLKGRDDQGEHLSETTLEISGENKTRHVFTSIDIPATEDIQVIVDYAEGDINHTCPIRKITLLGNYVER